MWRALLTVGLGVVMAAAGCGGDDAGSGTRQAVSASPATHQVRAGPRCSPLPVANGAPPAWAKAPGVPPPPIPYAVGVGGRAAAFFFVWPLRVKLPPGAANKILWVVDPPSSAHPLTITGRRSASGRPRKFGAGAGDSVGSVYRSRLHFPEAGCWRLTLRWGGERADLDVHVRP